MSMQDDAQKLIDDLSSAHFVELFKMYGVDLVPVDVAQVDSGALLYCGIIGFSGEGIRGSMAVSGSGALLAASNPTPDGLPRDWVAEVANQLMGHVKSRLLGFAVEVYMSTPIVLRGERLALEVRGVTKPRTFTDGRAHGHLALWIDVETTPEFKMASEENTSLSGLDGGETLMF
jgi:CheY-specific phosphatase CheX